LSSIYLLVHQRLVEEVAGLHNLDFLEVASAVYLLKRGQRVFAVLELGASGNGQFSGLVTQVLQAHNTSLPRHLFARHHSLSIIHGRPVEPCKRKLLGVSFLHSVVCSLRICYGVGLKNGL
jgi:hypothetical protein